ncbi:hypothetical protein [Henriciella aquimarina]|uniref:hypothetical protein n=1 Tax=Henriciella aquimarina TaxID=545261 RepID=UPI0009FE9540|nr:hypothetical protein [Henriciella aquimarina]
MKANVVSIPYTFAIRGGRKLVITPDRKLETSRPDNRNELLIKALARGFRWRRMLDAGQFQTIAEISRAENMSASYISRVSRLALLSPRIVEAILNGNQPRLLELDQLLAPFPSDWNAQLAHFGFDTGSH